VTGAASALAHCSQFAVARLASSGATELCASDRQIDAGCWTANETLERSGDSGYPRDDQPEYRIGGGKIAAECADDAKTRS